MKKSHVIFLQVIASVIESALLVFIVFVWAQQGMVKSYFNAGKAIINTAVVPVSPLISTMVFLGIFLISLVVICVSRTVHTRLKSVILLILYLLAYAGAFVADYFITQFVLTQGADVSASYSFLVKTIHYVSDVVNPITFGLFIFSIGGYYGCGVVDPPKKVLVPVEEASKNSLDKTAVKPAVTKPQTVKPQTQKPAVKTEAKPEVKPASKIETKPAAMTLAKPETPSVGKIEGKPVVKPEEKSASPITVKPAAPVTKSAEGTDKPVTETAADGKKDEEKGK